MLFGTLIIIGDYMEKVLHFSKQPFEGVLEDRCS